MGAGSEILAWKKEIENQPAEELTDCPDCGWSLEKTPKGELHCPFCGWVNKK